MDDLELAIAMDDIGQALKERGKTPDQIWEILTEEAARVAQEMKDENG